MSIYNKYSSIVPSEMSNSELRNICIDLQTAINWGLDSARVLLANGQEYDVPVSRIGDYRNEFKTETS